MQSGPAASGRRGRPTQNRTAEIDAAILTAAAEVFLAAGFDAANMDVIAAKAGVSKGTLYSRHRNKDSLFRTVLERQLELTAKRASKRNYLFPAELAPRLRHHAETMIDAFGWIEYQNMARLIETAARSQPDLANLWQDKVSKKYRNLLIEAMQETAGILATDAVDWSFLADIYLHILGSWLKTESQLRTIRREEALAYADTVIAVVTLTLNAMITKTFHTPIHSEKGLASCVN